MGFKLFNTILLLIPFLSQASVSTVKIELFNQFNLKTVSVSPIDGKYYFTTEKGRVHKLKKNYITYFTVIGDSISVWDHNQHLGIFYKIYFRGLTKNNTFKIEPAYPALPTREYNGDLEITAKNNKLYIHNTTNIDDYLAGVIEAEAGPNAPFEFYKVQAIISRTYLIEIIKREGPDYKIGDDVMFQVYKNRCKQNPQILNAVKQTSNLVIIDTANNLITAAFHSNSGGQTANSEDVWLKPAHYLKATTDTFSLNQRNTVWHDTISIDDWVNYLKNNGINTHNQNLYLNYIMGQRQKYLTINNDTLALKKIRKDLNLRSAWFSIKTENNKIIFEGKGYGHGVGLSQEGGMQMARLNYSFIDIIYFYYKGTKIVNYNNFISLN